MTIKNEHLDTLLGDDAEDQELEKEILEAEKEPEVEHEEPGEEQLPDESPAGDETEKEEPDEDKKKPPEGFVPHGALHEQRMITKQLKEQLEDMQGKYQSLSQLKTELEQWRDQRKQQEEQINADEQYQNDPVGFLKRQNEEFRNEIQNIRAGFDQQRAETQQEQQQRSQLNMVAQEAFRQEQEFKKEHTDYDQAFEFFTDFAKKEYQLYGINDPAQIEQMFSQQVLNLSLQAMNIGRNPAEIVYELARSRGFTAPSGAEQKIRSAQRGQQRSTTLSGGGGGGQPTAKEINLEDIAQLSDEEFDEFWKDMEKSNR